MTILDRLTQPDFGLRLRQEVRIDHGPARVAGSVRVCPRYDVIVVHTLDRLGRTVRFPSRDGSFSSTSSATTLTLGARTGSA
jgi:hypothetical protein